MAARTQAGLFIDALSYGATAITTSGRGGSAAGQWLVRALTAYEVACEVILLIVRFTVYMGHALAELPAGWRDESRMRREKGGTDGAVPLDRAP